jgi:transposase
VRLGGGKKERQLSAGPILPHQSRRGPQKAIMAVAASILTAIYHMLKDGTMYKDLGRDHFNRRSSDRQKKRLIKRLTDLGYAITIKPLAA